MFTFLAALLDKYNRAIPTNRERGDVPGWVLIVLMTAGLVVAIWALAGPALSDVFNDAIARVRAQ